jgi:adenine specific DNA methylase Mod
MLILVYNKIIKISIGYTSMIHFFYQRNAIKLYYIMQFDAVEIF